MGKTRIKVKRAIKLIDLYLSELTDPKFYRTKDEIMQASYARSTMLYLRKQIKEDASMTPRQIILLFISTVNGKAGYRYSVAYDTAVDFFDRYFIL